MNRTKNKNWSALHWHQVKFTGGMLGRRIETNRRSTLPIEHQHCERTGRIDAFKLDWKPGQPNPPHCFWDSDVAKWVEAAAYSLADHADPALEKKLDEVIDLIVAAQQPDGYLNVYYTVVKPGQRWTNLRDMHELYCAGHLMEAAAAMFEATGKRKLLDAMCRYADHIDSVFGTEPGKKRGYPGHEEIELALVKLHRATSERRYLNLARYFIDQRGQTPNYFAEEAKSRGEQPKVSHEYYQAEQPVRRQKKATGHAVRAMYLYAAMADVAHETADRSLLAACRRLWNNVTDQRLYLTGGIGSTKDGERFTFDYDLPNETAYAETCAAIGLMMFAQRMLQIERDGRYADVMERALYNGVLSGVSLKGDRFFYANPLTVSSAALGTDVQEHLSGRRQKWFGCACCPTNIARLLASLGQYVMSNSDNELAVHLYTPCESKAMVGGQEATLRVRTEYPWKQRIALTLGLRQSAEFTLALRIPGWCGGATLKINGKPVALSRCIERGYAKVRRTWRDADVVELELPMEVRRTYAHPNCRNDAGKVALQRGPIVYCVEEMDVGCEPSMLVLPRDVKLAARYEPKFLGGATVIHGRAMKRDAATWKAGLYDSAPARLRAVKFIVVPYCLWGNRREGPMQVWLTEA